MGRAGKALATALAAGVGMAPAHTTRAKPPKPAHVRPASQPTKSLEEMAFRSVTVTPYVDNIWRAAKEHGLDPFDFYALLFSESGLDARARNKHSGAAGVAQFTAGGRRAASRVTGRKFGLREALDPFIAIEVAAAFLAYLRDYCGSTLRAVAAYSSGQCDKALRRARYVLREAAKLRERSVILGPHYAVGG